MNARVKRVKAARAQNAVGREDGLVVVGVLKRRIWIDENRKGWIRRIIVDRADKDLPRHREAAAARDEINEGIISGGDQTY